MTLVIALNFLFLAIFWKWADFSRFRELLPIMLTAAYLRFLEHFIIIDWLRIWKVTGSEQVTLWLPISSDIIIWPISGYLFIQAATQKQPAKRSFALLWIPVMLGYLQLLIWNDVFTMEKGWHMGYSAAVISVYFAFIYLLWRWLQQKSHYAVWVKRED